MCLLIYRIIHKLENCFMLFMLCYVQLLFKFMPALLISMLALITHYDVFS